MHWLLIVQTMVHGGVIPTFHEFDSQTQCEIVRTYVMSSKAQSQFGRWAECFPLDGKEKRS